MSIFIRLDDVASSAVTVSYAFSIASGDTASSSDFVVPFFNTLTIPAGELSAELIVPLLNDAEAEGSETFTVTLNNVVGVGSITDDTAVGTIIDNDSVWEGNGYGPGFSVNDPEVVEGDNGTTELVFIVTLSAESAETVTVGYQTASGIAPDGADPSGDYDEDGGSLTFAPGETQQTVAVLIDPDTAAESNETIFLNLSNPVNAGLFDPQGEGVILNDDGAWIWVDDFELAEDSLAFGDGIPLTLDMEISSPVTVAYYAWPMSGSATADVDYQLTPGTVTFEPGGIQTRFVPFHSFWDGDIESNETLIVNLQIIAGSAELHKPDLTATNLTIMATILNDDGPVLWISDAVATEGDNGVVYMTFHISMTSFSLEPLSGPATVDVTILAAPEPEWGSQEWPDGVKPATIPDDVLMSPSTQTISVNLTVLPEDMPATITVEIQPDFDIEPSEIFLIQLSNPAFVSGSGAPTLLRAIAMGTIIDNDIDNPPEADCTKPIDPSRVQPRPGAGTGFTYAPTTIVWHFGTHPIQPMKFEELPKVIQTALKNGWAITPHAAQMTQNSLNYTLWRVATNASGSFKDTLGPLHEFRSIEILKIRIDMIEEQHKQYCYYELGQLGAVFSKLREAIAAQKPSIGRNSTPTAQAKYDPWLNHLSVNNLVTEKDNTILHESFHIVDDSKGWYLPAVKTETLWKAEGLAYAGQYLIADDVAPILQKFERELRSGMATDVTLRDKWLSVVTTLKGLFTTNVVKINDSIPPRNLLPDDISDFWTKVGFELRFATVLIPHYRSMIPVGLNFQPDTSIVDGGTTHTIPAPFNQ